MAGTEAAVSGNLRQKTGKSPAANRTVKRVSISIALGFLRRAYPDARCHLKYTSPFELLIACILSAQCTDKRVNSITPQLFKKYPAPRSFASAGPEELERDIFSTGFYKSKARAVIGCSGAIARKHGGETPSTMEALTALPGVGRKTANVVLANWFGKPGIIVDTHITRLSKRLGFSAAKTAEGIEKDLMELVPKKEWTFFSNSLGDHGREVCKAKKPLCEKCGIYEICVWEGKGGGAAA